MKTVLYFGIINIEQSRNKVYRDGLESRGYSVRTCTDRSSGVKKCWRLYKKHREHKGKYDVLIVGYGGYLTVPLAKILSKKPIIFDALCSFYETEILSRDSLKEYPFRMLFVRCVDWMSTRFADYILVETNKQKEYFIKKLKVKSEKLRVVYTGVDEGVFKRNTSIKKHDIFTVLFRGRIMSEAGVPTVVKAAKLLEKENIHFLIIGYGGGKPMEEFKEVLEQVSPKNVTYIGEHLPFDSLVSKMQQCHVSLGQFADHERLKRTIPHKAFESMALPVPYVTARTAGVSEVFRDKKHCLMVNPVDPEDLAEKILLLKDDIDMRERIAKEAYQLFQERFTASKIVQPLIDVIE